MLSIPAGRARDADFEYIFNKMSFKTVEISGIDI